MQLGLQGEKWMNQQINNLNKSLHQSASYIRLQTPQRRPDHRSITTVVRLPIGILTRPL